jgi:hypothetical protein
MAVIMKTYMTIGVGYGPQKEETVGAIKLKWDFEKESKS